jgi:hypothetical protein
MESSEKNIHASRPIDVTMVLADHAQISENKLFVSGGFWTDMTHPAPFAVALVFQVPPERAGHHTFELDLVDPDGNTAEHAEGSFDVTVPEGAPKGVTLVSPFVLKHGPMHMEPASYEWRLRVDGEGRDHWKLAFRVHAPA